MNKFKYYDALGLTRNATTRDINVSYRRCALRWHPERVPVVDKLEAEKRFGEIGEAYDVLSNHQRRAIYDQFGALGLKKGVPVGELEWDEGYTYHGDAYKTFYDFFGSDNPFAEIFEYAAQARRAVYNGLIGKGRKHQAAPAMVDLPCTLEELYTGTLKKMFVMRTVLLNTGDESAVTREESRAFDVAVKAGWHGGVQVKFEKAGNESFNHIPTDVIFVLKQLPHSRFTREGSDLVVHRTVLLADALSGCKIDVEAIDRSKVSVNITEVITPGYRKRIHGLGMPIAPAPRISSSTPTSEIANEDKVPSPAKLSSSPHKSFVKFNHPKSIIDNATNSSSSSANEKQRGDLLIHFDVEFPQYLTAEQKVILRSALESRERPKQYGY